MARVEFGPCFWPCLAYSRCGGVRGSFALVERCDGVRATSVIF